MLHSIKQIDNTGPLEVVEAEEGWFVIGKYSTMPAKDEDDAKAIVAEIVGWKQTAIEDVRNTGAFDAVHEL